jgi:hypothetical protein
VAVIAAIRWLHVVGLVYVRYAVHAWPGYTPGALQMHSEHGHSVCAGWIDRDLYACMHVCCTRRPRWCYERLIGLAQ